MEHHLLAIGKFMGRINHIIVTEIMLGADCRGEVEIDRCTSGTVAQGEGSITIINNEVAVTIG